MASHVRKGEGALLKIHKISKVWDKKEKLNNIGKKFRG